MFIVGILRDITNSCVEKKALEWTAYVIVPWLHLLLNLGLLCAVWLLQRLCCSGGTLSALVERVASFRWLKNKRQVELYADTRINAVRP